MEGERGGGECSVGSTVMQLLSRIAEISRLTKIWYYRKYRLRLQLKWKPHTQFVYAC